MGTNGTCGTMRDGHTVACTQTLEVPPLHGTLETLPDTRQDE